MFYTLISLLIWFLVSSASPLLLMLLLLIVSKAFYSSISYKITEIRIKELRKNAYRKEEIRPRRLFTPKCLLYLLDSVCNFYYVFVWKNFIFYKHFNIIFSKKLRFYKNLKRFKLWLLAFTVYVLDTCL